MENPTAVYTKKWNTVGIRHCGKMHFKITTSFRSRTRAVDFMKKYIWFKSSTESYTTFLSSKIRVGFHFHSAVVHSQGLNMTHLWGFVLHTLVTAMFTSLSPAHRRLLLKQPCVTSNDRADISSTAVFRKTCQRKSKTDRYIIKTLLTLDI